MAHVIIAESHLSIDFCLLCRLQLVVQTLHIAVDAFFELPHIFKHAPFEHQQLNHRLGLITLLRCPYLIALFNQAQSCLVLFVRTAVANHFEEILSFVGVVAYQFLVELLQLLALLQQSVTLTQTHVSLQLSFIQLN